MSNLFTGWTIENKEKLLKKMQTLGIMQGGIFNTLSKNLDAYQQLLTMSNKR